MLKIEDLKVVGLSEEQAAQIAEMSKNDEAVVIGTHRRDWWDKLDNDIAKIYGDAKPPEVKSYEHLNSVLTSAKQKADAASGLEEQVQSLKGTIETLNGQIASGGGDETLKTQIAQLQQTIADKDNEINGIKETLTGEVNTLKNKIEEEKKNYVSTAVLQAVNQYLLSEKVKFDPTIPENLLQETLDNRRKNWIKSVNPTIVGEGDDRTIVLRDERGDKILDRENNFNPLSPGKSFLTAIEDLLDKGRQANGTGAAGGGGGSGATVNLSTAKTQVEADELIVSHIITNEGKAKTDPDFADRQQELRKENGVDALPIR